MRFQCSVKFDIFHAPLLTIIDQGLQDDQRVVEKRKVGLALENRRVFVVRMTVYKSPHLHVRVISLQLQPITPHLANVLVHHFLHAKRRQIKSVILFAIVYQVIWNFIRRFDDLLLDDRRLFLLLLLFLFR